MVYEINSNQYINIKMINDNLVNKTFDIVPGLHLVTSCDTMLYKFYVQKVFISEKLSKKQNTFIKTIVYNGKLNKSDLSTRVRFFENFKLKSLRILFLHAFLKLQFFLFPFLMQNGCRYNWKC